MATNSTRVREYDLHSRDERSRTFYQSSAWEALREWKMNHTPLCELCSLNGIDEPADLCRYIIPIKKAIGWKYRLDLSFLQSLCHRCFGLVEAEADREKERCP